MLNQQITLKLWQLWVVLFICGALSIAADDLVRSLPH